MMKDCSLIDTKYTSQLLDNDIARDSGKINHWFEWKWI